MLTLNNLRPQRGSNRPTKRLGRGPGSGRGTRAGKGDKGQLARSGGGKVPAGFEGGQTPLYRRVPKQGFTNIFKRPSVILNVGDLEKMDLSGISEITLETLKSSRLVKSKHDRLTILGTGEIKKALKIKAHRVSPGAEKKIQASGGTVERLGLPTKSKKLKKKIHKNEVGSQPEKAQ